MGVLGYNSELGTGAQTAATAYNMCWLVAGLYLFSAVLMFVSLAFIYNLDVKTLNRMNADLAKRKALANGAGVEEVVEATAPETVAEDAANASDVVDETETKNE